MIDIEDKNWFRRLFFSPFFLVALFVVFIILSVFTINVYQKYKKAAFNNEKISEEIKELEKKKADLEKQIVKMQTASGLDEEIREKFNVSKPGEEVLTIIDKDKENDNVREEKSKGFFSKIWDWIKNIF